MSRVAAFLNGVVMGTLLGILLGILYVIVSSNPN